MYTVTVCGSVEGAGVSAALGADDAAGALSDDPVLGPGVAAASVCLAGSFHVASHPAAFQLTSLNESLPNVIVPETSEFASHCIFPSANVVSAMVPVAV